MKNDQIHFWKARIHNGFFISVLTLIILFTTACQPEEKKQRTLPHDTDTLPPARQTKETSVGKNAFPGGDTIQQDCQLIQGQAESLSDEYYLRETTEVRKKQILTELEKLKLEWKQMDCQQVFGHMAPHLPPAN